MKNIGNIEKIVKDFKKEKEKFQTYHCVKARTS